MDEITQQKINVVNEAASNPEALKGLALSSRQETIDQQKSRAAKNIDRAKQIEQKLVGLEQLKQTTDKNLEKAKAAEQEWVQVETDMYKAIRPFSMTALQSQLARVTDDADVFSDSLYTTFVEGSEDTHSLNDFVKGYRKERKTYHLRKEWLERWNEERVAKPFNKTFS